jgi:phospholipid-binding lipoprotein MlaA
MNQPYSGNRIANIRLSISGMLIGAVITLAGCATTGVVEQQSSANKVDPYENVNRAIFGFNDTVDDYLAAPVSKAYNWATPQFMRTGVFNFFSNLKSINVVINDALQAKFAQSARDTGRFALNTTMGLGGFVDVATHVGLEQNNEDFEQTLAVWGLPQGSYLVLPLIGPSTMRGVPGAAFDTATNPSTYLGMPINLISLLNTRANAEGSLKFIDEASLDPYVFTRESFLQWRNNLATDGKSESSLDLDDDASDDEQDDTAVSNKKDLKARPTLQLLPSTKK